MKILDRYILREIIPPMVISYLGTTFILVALYIVKQLDLIVNAGVSVWTLLRFIALTLPFQSVLTIPMAVLLGILLGFGRLSQDSEVIALRACGVSVLRMFAPVFLFSLVPFALGLILYVHLVPQSNLSLLRLRDEMLRAPVAGANLMERVFTSLGPFTVYAQSISSDRKYLHDLFLSTDNREIVLAKRGEMLQDPETGALKFRLTEGVRHSMLEDPVSYHLDRFQTADMDLAGPLTRTSRNFRNRGTVSLTELLEGAKESEAKGASLLIEAEHLAATKRPQEARQKREAAQNALEDAAPFRVEFHKRLSIPFASLIFAILGLPLGITNRRGGRSSGFAIAVGLFAVYYMFLAFGQGMGMRNQVAAWLAMWLPNMFLGVLGVVMLDRVNRDEPIKSLVWLLDTLSAFFGGMGRLATRTFRRLREKSPSGQASWRLDLPSFFRTLDRYLLREFLTAFGMVLILLMMLSFLTHFSERIDDMVEYRATLTQGFLYFFYRNLFWTFFSIHFAALVATLFTLGVFYKNSEIIAMQAAGVSIWRVTAPLLAGGVALGVVVFFYNDRILPVTNRKADTIMQQIKSHETAGQVEPNQWLRGKGTTVYHFLFYDTGGDTMNQFSLFDFYTPLKLRRRVEARFLAWDKDHWEGKHVREVRFSPEGDVISDTVQPSVALSLHEKPPDFRRYAKSAEEMNYQELRKYIRKIRESGYDPTRLVVDLHAKISLSFLSFVMILIGIPFSVVEPRQGAALRGIGMSLLIGALYFLSSRLFIELGHGGKLQPFLAAWAANLFFIGYGAYRLWRMPT